MTELQEEKMLRNAAVLEFLKENRKAFEGDAEIMHFFKKIQKDIANSLLSAENLKNDDTAFSEEKIDAKREACLYAGTLCDKVAPFFISSGEKDLIKKVKHSYLYFFRFNDFSCEEKLKEFHKLLHSKLNWFPADGINEEQLDIFKAKIKTFTDTPGSSSIVDRPTPELLVKLREDLKMIDVDLSYLGNYINQYEHKDNKFYTDFNTLVLLPQKEKKAITNVEFTILDSVSNNPLPNVTSTLSKSETPMTSDENGKIVYENCKAGRAIAIFVCEGYREYDTSLRINANQDNVYTISLEREI